VFVAQSSGRSHYGGRLVFDQNGYMFLTAGDRQASLMGDAQAHPAQDLGNHAGVIIRLHDDGSVPDDNPFVDQPGAMPEIWSYGHRNPQGLAIHPMTGDLWENEHGPQGGDELNRIEPGQNYGWPVIGYGVNYGGARIHNSTNQPGMTRPAHYWVPSIATSGLMIYTGEQFPDWQGDIFVGGMVGEQLAKLSMGEDGMAVTGETTMVSNMGRIRDVRQGPNGYIYLAIEDRRGGSETPILRLEPAD
jgi:glucose/arabinose dehydrogenase